MPTPHKTASPDGRRPCKRAHPPPTPPPTPQPNPTQQVPKKRGQPRGPGLRPFDVHSTSCSVSRRPGPTSAAARRACTKGAPATHEPAAPSGHTISPQMRDVGHTHRTQATITQFGHHTCHLQTRTIRTTAEIRHGTDLPRISLIPRISHGCFLTSCLLPRSQPPSHGCYASMVVLRVPAPDGCFFHGCYASLLFVWPDGARASLIWSRAPPFWY